MPTAGYIKNSNNKKMASATMNLKQFIIVDVRFFLVAAKTSATSIRCPSWPTTTQPSSQLFAVK